MSNSSKLIKRNSGFQDGVLSASLKKPFHKNWTRNKNGYSQHHCIDYLKGYCEGWKSKGVPIPNCLNY